MGPAALAAAILRPSRAVAERRRRRPPLGWHCARMGPPTEVGAEAVAAAPTGRGRPEQAVVEASRRAASRQGGSHPQNRHLHCRQWRDQKRRLCQQRRRRWLRRRQGPRRVPCGALRGLRCSHALYPPRRARTGREERSEPTRPRRHRGARCLVHGREVGAQEGRTPEREGLMQQPSLLVSPLPQPS